VFAITMLVQFFVMFHFSFPSLLISSSPPPQVEMEEYNEVVASSMAATDVGGSQQCLDIIKQGHASIGSLLATEVLFSPSPTYHQISIGPQLHPLSF
jgi:hypothetical protein